jgi:hypothetical protein
VGSDSLLTMVSPKTATSANIPGQRYELIVTVLCVKNAHLAGIRHRPDRGFPRVEPCAQTAPEADVKAMRKLQGECIE